MVTMNEEESAEYTRLVKKIFIMKAKAVAQFETPYSAECPDENSFIYGVSNFCPTRDEVSIHCVFVHETIPYIVKLKIAGPNPLLDLNVKLAYYEAVGVWR